MNAETKIGYVPYSKYMDHPDDRRRFPVFASRHGIDFELANIQEDYDIIVLHGSADLTGWLSYKKSHPHTRFIFEMVDSLLFQSGFEDVWAKGLGRFLIGKESRPVIWYKKVILEWIRVADAVLVSGGSMYAEARRLNKNVFLGLDYLEHEYQWQKTDYSVGPVMKLVWEGQGPVLPQFLAFREMLQALSKNCELHVVTSATYPRLGPLLPAPVSSLLAKLPIKTVFHEWNLNQNQEIFAQMDAAIIPLSETTRFEWNKPANKLLSFWFSGLPVLTSATPAYSTVEQESGGDFTCKTTADWIEKLQKLRSMKADSRQKLAERNRSFAAAHYGAAKIDVPWLKAFKCL